MLVLSRKRGETIVIGSEVAVTILSVEGGRVRLGVVAPMEVPVHREEIFERIANASPARSFAGCA
jgi:carbon storage regulator